MARLQATATALAQVMTPAEAGRAVLEQALGVFGAEAGAVYVLDGEVLRPQVEIRGRRPPFIAATSTTRVPNNNSNSLDLDKRSNSNKNSVALSIPLNPVNL